MRSKLMIVCGLSLLTACSSSNDACENGTAVDDQHWLIVDGVLFLERCSQGDVNHDDIIK